MSIESFDCLKREQDICSQNMTFECTYPHLNTGVYEQEFKSENSKAHLNKHFIFLLGNTFSYKSLK